jgi:hypothetical protein
MLDATSSLVSAPGAIRDFKVDWSFKTYRLSPNLSIEAQPVWTIFYNRPTTEKYQKAGKFMQAVSTLSISAGSLDFNDTIRLFSYAGKVTVYRGYDPLASADGFNDLTDAYMTQKTQMDDELAQLKSQLLQAKTRTEKDSLEYLVYKKRDEMDELKLNQKQRIIERQEQLKGKYWNATTIDIAAGRSFAFNRFLTERIDSISISPRSFAFWINGGFGIGRRLLITSQIRSESIKVLLPDSGKAVVNDMSIDFNGDTTFIPRDSLFVNFNEVTKNILSFGINIRYGTPRFNFFTEFFYTRDRIPTFEEIKWADGSANYGPGGKKKTAEIKEQYLAAFGGEWRASSKVILNFGIRSAIDKNFKFRSIIPLVSISCLMR